MSEDTKVGTETKVDEIAADEAIRVEKQGAEDLAAGGVKETVVNSDAVSLAKDSPVAEKEALPSFFMEKDDKHRVDVDILTAKSNGQILSVSRKGLGVNFDEFKYLRYDSIWFDFTIPTYEEMTNYRARSGTWRRDAQQIVIDRMQLRNFLLVWHLKDWSLTDRDGKKVELEHDKEGSLSDSSTKKVYSLHPTIVDVVLTILEKDILLF